MLVLEVGLLSGLGPADEGTNDAAHSDITAPYLQVIKGVKAAAPKARQLLLQPFNGAHGAEIAAIAKQLKDPAIVFGNTTGFYTGEDGLHPCGYAHISQIAPKMAALCLPLLMQQPAS